MAVCRGWLALFRTPFIRPQSHAVQTTAEWRTCFKCPRRDAARGPPALSHALVEHMSSSPSRQRAPILPSTRPLIAYALGLAVATCAEPTAPSGLGPNANLDGRAMATGLTINPANDTVLVGQTITLSASGVAGGKRAAWASSDTNVARVVSTGNTTAAVTGSGPGLATITAAVAGKSGTASVRVIPVPVRSVTVAPDSVTVQLGDSVQFTATPRDSAGGPLTGRTIAWSTPDTTVGTVSPTGMAHVRAHGLARIRATVEGAIGQGRMTVAVPELAVPTMSAPDSVNVGDTLVVKYSTQNLGDPPLADSIIVRIGLRSVATSTIVRATRQAVPRVGALGIRTDTVRFVVPSALPGSYTVVVYVDCRDVSGASDESRLTDCLAAPATAGAIPETNETNNASFAPTAIRGPQLAPTTFAGPDTVLSRSTVTASVTITNSGSATATGFDVIMGLYDVTTNTVVAAATVGTPVLGNRATRTVSVGVAIPGTVALTHQFQLAGYADCSNGGTTPAARLQACLTTPGTVGDIVESNENDNGSARSVVVLSNVARVNAVPDTVRFATIGDTTTITATAFDHNGAPVAGTAASWTSLDPAAVVTTSGLVRSVANGTARIVATIEGRADTTIAIVAQLVRSVVVTPDSALIAATGTVNLTSELRDASGAIVANVRPTWSSLDPGVAAVSDSGRVSGIAVGAARVVATSNGHADTGVVFVNPVGYTHRWLGVNALGWEQAANWYPHTIPSQNDSPFIPADVAQRPFLGNFQLVHSIKLAAGTSLDLRGALLSVFGDVDATGPMANGNIEMRGSGTLAGTVPSLTVRGPTQLAGRTSATSVSVQDSTGRLTLHGHTLVTQSIEVTGGARLVQYDPLDSILVSSSATFLSAGASVLSAGVLRVAGSFSSFGPPGSLVMSGSHTTIFDGTSTQAVTIADTTSGFHDVIVSNGQGGVQLQTTMSITGQLTLSTGGLIASQWPLRFTSRLPDVSQGVYQVLITAVGGRIALAQNHVLPGTIIVESGDTLRLNGHTLDVQGTLAVASAGAANPTPGVVVTDIVLDSLIVRGGFSLAGSALFSAGTLVANGDIAMNAGGDALFAASGTHTTILNGAPDQRLSMSSASFFNNLVIDNAGGVGLRTDIAIHGQLRGSGAGVVRSGGAEAPHGQLINVTGGVDVAGLVLDGTAISITGVRGLMTRFDNVIFQNSPVLPAQLRMRYDGPGEFFMNNITFATTPAPGTYWIDADTVNPSAGAITIDVSSPQWADGPANTRTGNATVTWRTP